MLPEIKEEQATIWIRSLTEIREAKILGRNNDIIETNMGYFKADCCYSTYIEALSSLKIVDVNGKKISFLNELRKKTAEFIKPLQEQIKNLEKENKNLRKKQK